MDVYLLELLDFAFYLYSNRFLRKLDDVVFGELCYDD